LHHDLTGGVLLGLLTGARPGTAKELWLGRTPELVAQDAKGADGVSESAGDILGPPLLQEIGSQRFVQTVARLFWRAKEGLAFR
jgi:hypothetical protein